MDDDTRTRKEARLARLRSQVAALEEELGAPSLDSDEDAGGGSQMDLEAGGGSDGTSEQEEDEDEAEEEEDEEEEGEEEEDEEEEEDSDDDDALQLSGGVAHGFMGPAGGGFWGGNPPPMPQGLTRVGPPQGRGAAGGDLSVHPPIAHPNTLHCPPTTICGTCECVSGQLNLGCCAADDPVFGAGDLFDWLQDQRGEASRTSNYGREGNNLHRKRMYQHCAVRDPPSWPAASPPTD